MAFYNRTTSVNAGSTTNLSIKNRIKKLKEENSKDDPANVVIDASNAADIWKQVYSGESIDVLEPGTIKIINDTFNYTQEKAVRVEDKRITELMKRLHNNRIFEQISKGSLPEEIMNRAIDYNNRISYSAQKFTDNNSSLADMKKSYKHLKQVQENKGKVFIFDTETIGGKNTSGVWQPTAITEFAMQEIDYATGETKKTNIVMGIAPTKKNQELLDTVEKLIEDEKWSVIESNEQYAVTAKRMALYADAKIIQTSEGYSIIESLPDSDTVKWKNVDTFKKGRKALENAYNDSKTLDNGLKVAEDMFLKSLTKMHTELEAGNASLVGQNFIDFDMRIVNMQLLEMKDMYKAKFDKAGKGAAEYAKAYNTVNKAMKKIGGGFTVKNEHAFDTLTLFSAIREYFGVDTLLNNRDDIIQKAAGRTARQEHVGAAWFVEEFEDAMAHMADFDVNVLSLVLNKPIKQLNGSTLLDYFMNNVTDNKYLPNKKTDGLFVYKGLDLTSLMSDDEKDYLYMNSKDTNLVQESLQKVYDRNNIVQGLMGIDTGDKMINNVTIYRAKSGTSAKEFQGKGLLNFTYNKSTGEVFTASGYNSIDGKFLGYSDKAINMGTNIRQGGFYIVDAMGKLNTDDIDPEIRKLLPDNSSPDLFHIKMRRLVNGDNVTIDNLDDIEYNFFFNSEKEAGAWFANHMQDMATTYDGKTLVYNEDNMDLIRKASPEFQDLSNDELMDLAVKESNEAFLTDKVFNNIINNENSELKKTTKILKVKEYLEEKKLTGLTGEDISKLIKGEPLETISEQRAKELRKGIINTLGFEHKGINQQILYSNTANYIAYAYDNITSQDKFLNQVLKDFNEHASRLNYNYKEREMAFHDLMETFRIQAASYLNTSDEKEYYRAVTGTRKHINTVAENRRYYDVKLPSDFLEVKTRTRNIVSAANPEEYKDILRIDLERNNPVFDLVNKVTKAVYSDKKIYGDSGAEQRKAMRKFVNVLMEDEAIRTHDMADKLNKLVSKKEFGVHHAASYIIDLLKDIKSVNAEAGIIKEVNERTLEMSDELLDIINNKLIQGNNIKKTIESQGRVYDFSSKKKEEVSKFVKNNLISFYMPDWKEFSTSIANRTDEQKWVQELLYNNLSESIANHLTDIIHTTSKIQGANVIITPSGQIVAKKGQDVIPINLPKVLNKNGTLVGQLGSQRLNLNLKLNYTSNGKGVINTNLGELFNFKSAVGTSVEKSIEEGKFVFGDLERYIARVSKQFREESVHSGTAGDYLSNYYIDVKNFNKQIPDIFHISGGHRDVLSKSIIPQEVIDTVRNKIAQGADFSEGEIDPALNLQIAPYKIDLIKSLEEARGNTGTDFYRLVSGTTTGVKDKSKAGKDKYIGANTRFQVGFWNPGDDNSRPVIYSAGNVKYFAKNDIENMTKNSVGNMIEGSIFESFSMNDSYINRIVADGVGEASSSFTGKIAYMGQLGIDELLRAKAEEVINNNIELFGSREATEKAYNRLYGLISTFEQAKVFSATDFENLTGGIMASDIQKLSIAKDISSVADNADPEKLAALLNLRGDIIRDEDGRLRYKSRVGKIVKQGENVVEYSGFGGSNGHWVSKFHRGVLGFGVYNSQNMRLSDEKISDIINENAKFFEGIDLANPAEYMPVFDRVIESLDMKAMFTIEDINKTSLPKIMANDAEKSMNQLLYGKIGTINENIEKVLNAYGEETANLIAASIPTPQALRAFFTDDEQLSKALSKGGFESYEAFEEAVKEEGLKLTQLIFGEKGILPGFQAIGNDNLSGHKNKATMLSGSLGSAVEILGKHLRNPEDSELGTMQAGMKKLVEIINKSIDEDNGELSIFTHKKAGQKDKHVKLEFKNGHIYLEGGKYLEQGLNEYDTINTKGAENLYRYIDDMLEKYEKTSGVSIPASDRLVHIDKEGKEFVGSVVYAGDKFVGSYGHQTMKVINDSEVKSGLPSEYINTLKEIKDLKKQREDLYKEIRKSGEKDSVAIAKLGMVEERIKNLEGLARDFEEVGHLYSFGIQEMNILNQYRLSKDSEEIVKRNMARGLYKNNDVVQNLESLKGLSEDYFDKSRKVFNFVEEELTKEMYYNPLTEDKLTKKMIKKDEYKHLADIYHEYKNLGIELSEKSAQEIFELRTASLAESFNNSNGTTISKDELINKHNFIELTPEQYLKSYGDPDLMDFDSVVKSNVILNLGEEFGANQYVAVPAMGSIVGKETIKQDWHRKAGFLSAFYVDEYANLDGVDPKEAMETIVKRVDDIKASTSEFVTKGGALHERSKRRIQTQNIRLKIMNTGDSEFNHLLKQAHIDGYSLRELHDAGVHYDYAFDTIETFEQLGYFDDDVIKGLGLKSKEEAIEYYKKHGVVDVDDRFPNIIRTSITPVTHFLNTDEQATNTVLFASHTNLRMNADSDGDSATRIHLPDIDGVDYNIYRKKRLDAIELAKTMDFDTNLEREAFIKKTILDSGVSDKAYDAYKDVDVFLSMEALKGNQNWYNRARSTLEGDAKKTKEAQTISVGGTSTIAEVSDGKSILGKQKLVALNVDPTSLETKENLLEVNKMLELVDKNRDFIKTMDGGDEILEVLSEGNNILSYSNESKALDRALTALEFLKDSGTVDKKVLNNNIFDSYQEAAIKRVRIGNYYSEMMSKIGITATGNVNATLYGITQTAKVYYGNENLSTFDNAKRLFIETMNYEIEQSPISSKKIQVKAGDTRLMTFTDLMREFKQKGMGRKDDEESIYNNLYNWLNTYMDKGKIVKQYENILQEENLNAKYVFNPKTQENEITDYMINRWLNTTNELYTNPVTRENVDIYSMIGRNKATPLTIQKVAGSDFDSFLDRAIADTSGIRGKGINPPPSIDMPSIDKESVEKIAKEVYGEMKTKSNKRLDEVAGVVSNKLTKPNNTGAALALGVVGLATGLIAAGYASGNPLKDANPETVAKEQTAPKLSFGPDAPQIMPNNTGGYIINIKGDTSKGNRQLKRAMRQAAKSSAGGNVNINMSLRTSKAGGYDDKDIENILNDYF